MESHGEVGVKKAHCDVCDDLVLSGGWRKVETSLMVPQNKTPKVVLRVTAHIYGDVNLAHPLDLCPACWNKALRSDELASVAAAVAKAKEA